MSTELDRAIDALRARADAALLPPAVDLRARSDHRHRLTLAVIVAAVTVVVLGAALGASVLRPTAAISPAVTPSVTATPSPTAEPTVEPTPSVDASPYPTGSPVHLPAGCIGDDPYVLPDQGPKVAGQALPKSMMLTAANWGRCWVMLDDVGGYVLRDPDRFAEPPGDVCDLAGTYAAEAQRVAGRFRSFVAGPETGGYQAVTRYRPGQAASFMDEVRAAVQACDSYLPQGDGITYHARIVETGFAGDESLMIYTGPDSTPTKDTYPASYMAVVRVGDLVTVVEPSFDLGGDRAMAKTLAQRAATRL
jgi:hypothetical protein